ncbi:unnamed protein product [Periconia digitata]|uniref:BTB domain-containing protein n=1 Tax=Periconia digitata TaxID=1303443 RepID=A0A9W4U3E0_9PLEO|nr:unnamed protein product [Periconia digitata]
MNHWPTHSESHGPSLQPTISMGAPEDVTLLLGPEKQPVRASIAVLCRSSSVWEAMFSGDWNASEKSEIEFPDDDVEAMLLVLRIAHLKFKDLPGKQALPLGQLLQLTLVTEKYDVVHIVRPFLEMFEWASIDKYVEHRSPFWLLVTWTFGYSESFAAFAIALIRLIEITEGGSIEVAGVVLLEKYMPPGIVESMLRIREETIDKMLTRCYNLLDGALTGPSCLAYLPKMPGSMDDTTTTKPSTGSSQGPKTPVSSQGPAISVKSQEHASFVNVQGYTVPEGSQRHKIPATSPGPAFSFDELEKAENKSICSSIILGSLMAQITRMGLNPIRKSSQDITSTVQILAGHLCSLQPTIPKTYDTRGMTSSVPNCTYSTFKSACTTIHESCAIRYRIDYEIAEMYREISSPVLDMHIKHMEEQAKK